MAPRFETLVSWGVDYVTATCKDRKDRPKFEALGRGLLFGENSSGCELREWQGFGYCGLAAGSVQVGVRGDSTLLRISGPLAAEHTERILRYATNVSRIDFQSTARITSEDSRFAERIERAALLYQAQYGRRCAVRLLRDSLTGKTITLGRRVSSRFIRIYDKYAESKLPEYERCWRAEVQYNGSAAWVSALGFKEFDFDGGWLVNRVHSELGRKGIPWMCQPKGPRSTPYSGARKILGGFDRNLEWLHSQVRPTVEKLVRAGRRDDVLRALNLFPEGE